MNNSHLINPYSLLGLDENSTISDLKKNYYSMSLLCHPDKGGSGDDMYIVSSAYKYIKNQLENKEERKTTYETLENDFKNFCNDQETKPPSFNQIYEETNDWINEFNNEFQRKMFININENKEDIQNPYIQNPFDINNGYGEFMDESEYNENNDLLENNINSKFDYNENEINLNKSVFKKDIIQYKEPEPIPDTINYYPLDNTKISDYSGLEGNLKMGDYYRTFSECDQPSKVTHNKPFNNFPSKLQ